MFFHKKAEGVYEVGPSWKESEFLMPFIFWGVMFTIWLTLGYFILRG